MRQGATVGVGSGIDGHEASTHAVGQALSALGSGRPAAALVFISQEYGVQAVMNGLGGALRNIPTWGFSTFRPVTERGEHPRSVIVVLIAGIDLKARSLWLPGFADSSGSASRLMDQVISDPQYSTGVLVAVDGHEGDAADLCKSSTPAFLPLQIAGGLASSSDYTGKTYQITANQFGSGGMSALLLGGRFRLGVGNAHGWRDLGLVYDLNQVEDNTICHLNDQCPNVVYENLFGFPASEWSAPPLVNLLRMYPFGVEDFPGSADLILRSPLAMNSVGHLCMGTHIENGSRVHMMVGDRDRCAWAATQAAEQALQALGKARPIFGMLLVDLAWHYLFEGQAERYLTGVQHVLGEIPLAGAYTLGQIANRNPGSAPRLYNQHFQVVLIGEGIE